MGSKTAISWTDATWNPWRGCHKVSAGCKHCYMFREQAFYGNDPNIVVRSKTTFNDPLKWARAWGGDSGGLAPGSKIFTCSWSDWFIYEADPWRAEAWDIIKNTPYIYQIVTKRTERIEYCLPPDWGAGYPNVWLIVSVEDEESAAWRIPALMRIPAAIRGVSYEPALGPVDWTRYPGLDWIIFGGESEDKKKDPNHAARECHIEWLDGLMQARWHHSYVGLGRPAIFVKQMGSLLYSNGARVNGKDPKGADPDEWPQCYRIQEFPRFLLSDHERSYKEELMKYAKNTSVSSDKSRIRRNGRGMANAADRSPERRNTK